MASSDGPNPVARFVAALVSSRPGTWLYLNVFPHVDRQLLRLSGGRLSVSLGAPVLLLHTRGARTGELRTTPLVYVADGENAILIASNGGQPRHPAWYHNLRKQPRARCTLRGSTRDFVSREAVGAERDECWAKALRLNPGYATYEKRAGGRRIPLLVLEPVEQASGPPSR